MGSRHSIFSLATEWELEERVHDLVKIENRSRKRSQIKLTLRAVPLSLGPSCVMRKKPERKKCDRGISFPPSSSFHTGGSLLRCPSGKGRHVH